MSSIRICIVGAGRVGKQHARSITRRIPRASCVALVDPNRAALDAAGAEVGCERRFARLEDALAEVAFDAVVITTPTATHRSLAVLAADAGKHVFLEKPMALDLAECDAIVEATRRAGVVLQIGFMRRFDPEFEAAAARIESGEIGRPMVVKSLTHGPGLPPAWASDLRTSNGMLAEVNSHDWDTLRWLAGSEIERVYAEWANFKGVELGVTAPGFFDTAVASVRFESGALGTLSGVCPCGYGYDARVEIVGERGIMQIGELAGQAVVVCTDRERGLLQPIYRSWPERFESAYVRELEHFARAAAGEAEPRATGADGRAAVAAVLAANRSLRDERPVRLAEPLDARASAGSERS